MRTCVHLTVKELLDIRDGQYPSYKIVYVKDDKGYERSKMATYDPDLGQYTDELDIVIEGV